MNDYCCRFTYNRDRDGSAITAVGIERPFPAIAAQVGLTGQACPQAHHFERISESGPKLFAVRDNTVVFYYLDQQWIPYSTARNITFGTRYHFFPPTPSDDNEDDSSQEENGNGLIDESKDGFGRRVNDLRGNSNPSNEKINQMIVFFLVWFSQFLKKQMLRLRSSGPYLV
jgi:hypothetical protein